MKNILTLKLIFFLFFTGVLSVSGQPLPCPPGNTTTSSSSGDTTICNGGCATIHATGSTSLRSTSDYTITSIPYLPTTFQGGNPVLVNQDDYYSQALALPFDFCFYGTKYTSCAIGANGEISFNPSAPNAYCPWQIGGPVPTFSNEATYNTIMGAYYDIDPQEIQNNSGSITWAIYGTAPCRTFVVSWYNIPLYNTGICPGQFGTQQIVLYESTYAIDIFLQDKPLCAAWNGGKAILGLENADGTQTAIVTGRNATQWSATNEGWRFTPNGSPTWTFTWFDPNNNIIGTNTVNGDTATSNITVCPTQQTVYKVKAVANSNCDSLTYWDSVIVRLGAGPNIDSIAFTNPTGCGYHDGTISLHGVTPGDSFIVNYNLNNVAQPGVIVVGNAFDVITVTGLGAGTYSNIVVSTITGCTSNTVGPVTLVDPVVAISGTSKVDPSICGTFDGSLTLEGLIPDSTYHLVYTINNVAQPSQNATADASGNITLNNLGSGSYQLYVTFRGCTSNTVTVDIVDPPFSASYTYTVHLGCDADTVIFNNTSIGAFHFGWNFDDGSGEDTTINPVHIFMHHTLYNVTLYSTNYHCVDSVTKAIDLTHPLVAAFTTSDDSICQRTSIDFTNNSVATPPVAYWWDFGDGTNDSAMTPSSHYYGNAGIYTISLAVTDFISCHDTAYRTLVVDTIPYAFIVPTDTDICQGKMVSFDAVFPDRGSTGITWDFTDGQYSYNQWPVTHSFDAPGIYNVKLNVGYSYCPDTYAVKKIVVRPYPIVNLGPDTAMCPNAGSILLADHVNSGNPNASWLWNTGAKTNYIHVTEPGEYSATVTIDGCSNSDTVSVKKDCYIDIPNSFTPNGDGINDYFFPRNLLSMGVTDFKMIIYNRWGQEIFKTTNTDGRGWDGKFNDTPQPFGVYVYVIDVSFKDGRSEHYQGNLTLLR
jgi:gliding motility-associated-like protein